MTGKTHRVGGVLSALIGYSILSNRGMLINDVSPLVQLTVMYPFAIYGSTVSDLDHHWNSAPSKDIVSYIINKLLHLTTGYRKATGSKNLVVGVLDAKHRSWQTHSDLFLLAIISLAVWLIGGDVVSANEVILKLVFTGFLFGVVSHLILDMLTPEGIWFLLGSAGMRKPVKLHLVPSSKFFATGGMWESAVRVVMWVLSFMLLVWILYSTWLQMV